MHGNACTKVKEKKSTLENWTDAVNWTTSSKAKCSRPAEKQQQNDWAVYRALEVDGYGQDSQTMKCCVCTQVIWPGSSNEAYMGKTSTGVSKLMCIHLQWKLWFLLQHFTPSLDWPLCLFGHDLSDSESDALIHVKVYAHTPHAKGKPWHTKFQQIKKKTENKNTPSEFFEGGNTLWSCKTGVSTPPRVMKNGKPCTLSFRLQSTRQTGLTFTPKHSSILPHLAVPPPPPHMTSEVSEEKKRLELVCEGRAASWPQKERIRPTCALG